MSVELTAVAALAVGAAATAAATPAAIRLAHRTGFYDHPREYRKHAAPTPFLGGAAVLIGCLAAAVAVGAASSRLALVLGCAVCLWLLGTADDRLAVAPKWRLLAEALTAIALAAGGLGWATSAGDGADYLLTIVWVVGLVNAFNLMDNMDGACGAVGGISALAIGVLAALHGQTLAAGLSFALAGACGGFLPWNLAGPAKVFLGDGGSMLVGFLVAALAMAAERHLRVDGSALLTGAMLVGVPILDTALVTFSRLRRRVPLVTGGRDHLTHRILLALRSPRTVAATLAVLQGVLCAAAITGDQLGSGATAAIACSAAVLGAFAILVLDAPRWRPAGIAVGRMPLPSQAPAPSSVGVDSG